MCSVWPRARSAARRRVAFALLGAVGCGRSELPVDDADLVTTADGGADGPDAGGVSFFTDVGDDGGQTALDGNVCGPANCAGCCAGYECVAGTDNIQCGMAGEACMACSTEAMSCLRQACM